MGHFGKFLGWKKESYRLGHRIVDKLAVQRSKRRFFKDDQKLQKRRSDLDFGNTKRRPDLDFLPKFGVKWVTLGKFSRVEKLLAWSNSIVDKLAQLQSVGFFKR
ncbi:hypothetical protein TNCV_3574631 [Trichonephila clavipes]|nr:hypothetical protein TNCV_3574631 [Trichonephila clavipes]